MNWLNEFARPEILNLIPYCSARSDYSGIQEIKLDANESPEPPYGENNMVNMNLNRYPEPQPSMLKEKLANLYEIDQEQLLITRGMDEGIDLLIRVFCKPYQDSVVIIPPTFGYYEVAAKMNAISVLKISRLDNFDLDFEGLKTIENQKVLFLCSPNNPTGNLISVDKIKNLCQLYSKRLLIVVDEAYIEFADGLSATTLLQQFDNLIVMRTLSKAYGLAGARIGVVIANKVIIKLLQKVLPPYPISTLSAKVALDSLSPMGLSYAKKQIDGIKKERDRVYRLLKRAPNIINVYQSEANFILIKVKDANILYETLKRRGIIVRNRQQDVPGTLRLSIGCYEENQQLLAALGLVELSFSKIRTASSIRKTKETEVMVFVTLDDKGVFDIKTGIYFFDHMLEQLSRHSGISLEIKARGDLQVDNHHTIEDVAIVLGSALQKALGDKQGIARYGFLLPMDEAQAKVSIDLDGRGYCVFDAIFNTPQIGGFSSEMVKHFFTTLSNHLKATIHISITGENTHHMIEACFKCFAKTLKQAIKIDGCSLPSTKGVL